MLRLYVLGGIGGLLLLLVIFFVLYKVGASGWGKHCQGSWGKGGALAGAGRSMLDWEA